MFFKEMIELLDNGDHLTYLELLDFKKDAETVINILKGVPDYRLVVIDLNYKLYKVEQYIAQRKSQQLTKT